EFFQHVLARRPLDAAVGEVAPEVRLEEVPAPRRDHWRAECTTRPGGKLHGVTNFELARLFYEMASLLEVRDESRFRIRAWQRAAQTLETLSEDVAAVAARGGLRARRRARAAASRT